MTRAQRITSWVLLACALAIVSAAVSFGTLGGPAWRVGVAGAAALAVAIAARCNRMPWPFHVALLAGTARVVTMPTRGVDDPVSALGLGDTIASGLTGIALVTALTLALRRRRGPLDDRDISDGMSVAISASLVSWILISSRLMALHDVEPLVAIGASVYLPIAVFVFTFVVDLLMAGLGRNRTMQLVTLAAALHLAATVMIDFALVGVWSPRPHVEAALFGAALLVFAAALVHPDAPETVLRTASATSDDAYTPFRIAITGACLVFPGVLLAALDTVDQVDLVVRVMAVVALVGAVLVRLLVAIRGQQAAHDQMVDRLQTDHLTGLPTRSRFLEVVGDVLEETWRSGIQPSVVQLNLDRFKNINDSLGHDEANQVLLVCGQRLAAAAAEIGGEIARLGGDDFAVIDPCTTSVHEALLTAEKLRAAISQPVRVGESVVFVTASLGVAVAPRHRTITAEELLRRSDIATFRAKGSGRNGLAVFDDAMQQHLSHRMDIEHALYGAIGREEMCLYYQPIVDLTTGELSGFEALLRWRRDGVVVSPGQFIEVAEETGLIIELGAWVIGEALRELRGWIDDGVVPPGTTMSVNVSPRQIASPGFAQIVEAALARTHVRGDQVWLEVTESMMLSEPELAQATLLDVQSLGVRVALDDFGTGYSSLSMLQRFPIQRIKIDRAFVQGIARPGNDRLLVRTIIAMADSMHLDLVAEGVEDIEQLRTLAELGCDRAQGYLISRPVPADAMRSTMVALSALGSLSLVDATGSTVGCEHQSVSDARSKPIGNGATRPIGQPVH